MNLYRKFRNPLVLSILLFLTFFQNINNQTQSNNSIAVQTPSSSTISDKYYINYSTYLGGDSNDWAGDVYVDSYGFIYVCGYTSSSDFPSTFGNYIQHSKDIFILKLSPDGSEILFSRVIEGNGYDVALEIIVGNNGYIYVSGYTDSTNLPLTNNSYQTEHKGDKDIFVIKLSPDGEILNFTLLGGSGYDVVNDMKVDEEGCVYLIGKPSDGFPTTEGSFNTSFVSPNKFLSKFNENLTQLEYSTFLGSYMYTDVESLFIDEENNAYIVGRTEATGFIYTYSFSPIDPYRNNDDIFVMKFNSKGTDLIYSTLIGGSYAEQYKTSSMDENNNVIVIGWTYSYDFPSTETNTFSSAVYPSDSVPFLFKLGSDGITMKYSVNPNFTLYDSIIVGENKIFSVTPYYDDITIKNLNKTEFDLWEIEIELNSNTIFEKNNYLYILGTVGSDDFSVTDNALFSYGNGNTDITFRIIEIFENEIPVVTNSFDNCTFNITWYIDDFSLINPNYKLYLNNSLIREDLWQINSSISQALLFDSMGIYNYTLIFDDGYGGFAQSSFIMIIPYGGISKDCEEINEGLVILGYNVYITIISLLGTSLGLIIFIQKFRKKPERLKQNRKVVM